jgi:uncharacterized protein YceK
MRGILLALTVALGLTGCSVVALDLQGAQARAKAAQAAGLLGPNDPLVPCLQYFAGATSAHGGLAVLKGPFAGLIDVGTDLYILDALAQAGGTSDTLDAMCGGVAMKILKNAGRRAPGL